MSFRKTAKSDSTGSISKFSAENSQNACPWNGIWCTQHTREVVDLIFSQIALEGALFPSLANLKLILNGNLDTAFSASMAVFSARSTANCIQLAAPWKFGHSISSFLSSLHHCNYFLATMRESWVNRIKLLDLMENALIAVDLRNL